MTDPSSARPRVVHLRRGGTSVVLRLDDQRLPTVLHWGADLGDVADDLLPEVLVALRMPLLDSAVTVQDAVAVLPQRSTGWLGRPGLLGSREGHAWMGDFDFVHHSVAQITPTADGQIPLGAGPSGPDAPIGSLRVTSVATDRPSELVVTTELEVLPSGLIRVRATVENTAERPYEVTLLEPALPVPAEAAELLDMTGRHTHERTPQRRPFDPGQWVREAWGGRPGHDATNLLCAGRPGFGFRSGRVWAVHLAWSGNQVLSAEHSTTGWRLLRGGELLLPGEIRLETGQRYTSPWLVGSWGDGLDELSSRFHRHLRARPNHPSGPRPVLLNTWEAVYFRHDPGTLLSLAERAAALGVERYVLDDGWFHGRRDDRAGLGDWYVDPDVWPDGLHPLVDRVHGLGMHFGLWFEPEMVNLDSDLARAHPDWLLRTEHGPGMASRYQHVLDLGNAEAYAYVLDRMSALCAEYRIAFIKWDHNRALLGAGDSATGVPGVHRQTEAVYRLMGELKDRHAGLEIESCCGGGGRLDLAIVERTDRVWVSDCIDAHERHRIVRWTGLTLPPELLGTHVGSGVDHTTGRSHVLEFRAGTAIWGHLGVEWDLTKASDDELAELAAWVAFHKEVRPLLHSGDVVHADLDNPALQLEGVVAQDGSEALYRLSALDHTLTWPPGRVPLPGLRPDRTYRVTRVRVGAKSAEVRPRTPAEPDWAQSGAVLPGRVLTEVGVQSPLILTDNLVLIRAQAV